MIQQQHTDTAQAFYYELIDLTKKELIELLWLSLSHEHTYEGLHTAEKARETIKHYGVRIEEDQEGG